MRLIDADELINKLNKFESDVHGSAECYSSETEIIEAIEHVGNLIDEVPTVEAVPVVHGEWRHIGGDEWCCSECGNVISTEGSWEKPTGKFCEECGADMRKKV